MSLPLTYKLASLFLGTALLTACAGPHGDSTLAYDTRALGPTFTDSSLRAPGAAPELEVHGEPIKGMSAEQVAKILELPASYPTDIRFKLRETGDPARAQDYRIVLLFNGVGGYGPSGLCNLKTDPQTNPAPDGGYHVEAAYCRGDGVPVLYTQMQASNAATDEAFVKRTLRRLMSSLFQVQNNDLRQSRGQGSD